MGSNERIREIVLKVMEKNALTYSEISRRSGVSDDTVWNFLHRERNLTLKSADKLLASFGLEIGIRRKQNG